MPPKTFKCKQCGKCCRNLNDAFQTSVTGEDIMLFEVQPFLKKLSVIFDTIIAEF